MIQVYHSIFAELIRDFIAYKRAVLASGEFNHSESL